MTLAERGDTLGPSEPTSPPVVVHADLTGDLRVVVESLHETYDDQVGAAVVDHEIQEVADGFMSARIRAYIPLFVRRYAGARLRADRADVNRSSVRASKALGQA